MSPLLHRPTGGYDELHLETRKRQNAPLNCYKVARLLFAFTHRFPHDAGQYGPYPDWLVHNCALNYAKDSKGLGAPSTFAIAAYARWTGVCNVTLSCSKGPRTNVRFGV